MDEGEGRARRISGVGDMSRLRAVLVASVLFAIAAPATAVALLGDRHHRNARASATAAVLPPIRHVWVIMLENENYASTFGSPSADPYLATTLPAKGALLENYYATGHASNDNYISFVSGQPPNPENQSDCQIFGDFRGGRLASNGVRSGLGCVYPADVPSIGTQLTAAGRTWKAYEQDMGNVPGREAAACGHPALNSVDRTESAVGGDGYATRHDPFVYFHSVIDDASYCGAHVVALGSAGGAMPAAALPGETGLATDLKSAATTPSYSFITPNLCEDGHDHPCTNEPGGPSALADVDSFLSTWVPKIMRSAAYRAGGLIEITFDESDGTSDSSACCGETPGPGSPLAGITGPGGGRVGAVLLSPYIAPGTRTTTAYNHYSSLASVEDLFGVRRLGEAQTVTSTFGQDIFTRSAPR
ncbi:MAG: alkaline phosphatase family protein [Solirubrobacteraceae bacterium]